MTDCTARSTKHSPSLVSSDTNTTLVAMGPSLSADTTRGMWLRSQLRDQGIGESSALVCRSRRPQDSPLHRLYGDHFDILIEVDEEHFPIPAPSNPKRRMPADVLPQSDTPSWPTAGPDLGPDQVALPLSANLFLDGFQSSTQSPAGDLKMEWYAPARTRQSGDAGLSTGTAAASQPCVSGVHGSRTTSSVPPPGRRDTSTVPSRLRARSRMPMSP